MMTLDPSTVEGSGTPYALVAGAAGVWYSSASPTYFIDLPLAIEGVLTVPRSQAYYWTLPWQIGEAEADEDIRLGRIECFDSMAEAIEALFERD